MKNVQKSCVKYFISSALLLLAFGPNFAFGMFAGHPVYSHETGSTENQEKGGSADKSGIADQSRNEKTDHQKFVSPEMTEDEEETTTFGYK